MPQAAHRIKPERAPPAISPLNVQDHLNVCVNSVNTGGSSGKTDTEVMLYQYVAGFAPIFPDTCYHLTHYWLAAVDIPVASDNPVHYADAIRYNAR
ncbi:hypothetical protein, partial [Escherichia marmotae]|uniref:hypothetical protein n=1 Tax=Escherichia marmotae TaxID=1499973 RepID=UPI002814DD40